MAEVQPQHFHEQQADRTGRRHSDQRDQIRPSAGGAGEAEEELLAVLHANRVEEKCKADRPDHRRRRCLRREPAHRQRDEQHRADA